jgi:acetyltransferase
MTTIEQLTAGQARAFVQELADILCDSVDDGASVGFLPPLSRDEAGAYWSETIGYVERGTRLLLIARTADGVAGTVQLDLATKPNAIHRAEVQKLLVHTRARRQGLGERLMEAAEQAARAAGRTLLVLDTREGDPSELLYQKCGYTRAGIIPQYVRSANGGMDATVIYYKLL